MNELNMVSYAILIYQYYKKNLFPQTKYFKSDKLN